MEDQLLVIKHADIPDILCAFLEVSLKDSAVLPGENRVVGYTRYGSNDNIAPIFDAICASRIIRILSEHDEEYFL